MRELSPLVPLAERDGCRPEPHATGAVRAQPSPGADQRRDEPAEVVEPRVWTVHVGAEVIDEGAPRHVVAARVEQVWERKSMIYTLPR